MGYFRCIYILYNIHLFNDYKVGLRHLVHSRCPFPLYRGVSWFPLLFQGYLHKILYDTKAYKIKKSKIVIFKNLIPPPLFHIWCIYPCSSPPPALSSVKRFQAEIVLSLVFYCASSLTSCLLYFIYYITCSILALIRTLNLVFCIHHSK